MCGGNPCSEGLLSHVQFLVTVPNLQAGAHGILDPPCANEATVLDGISGLITLDVPAVGHDVLSLSKLFDDFSGYSFVICMNNSRNRSPLRIFQYFTHFCDFCPMWDKDGLPELSM